ncbi:hypothetical protein BI308_02575 [Roseofilum reptotaenium AO1-A]|uniref:Uncharacterized protein n=2 Tax=Roseofilum TaxID=1233426 RepID=A0A1L9QXF7_9CYAN|nr:hypothetical protein BI308_02575 [Roseofilum reptotaenium AO1-A]
MPTNVVPRVKTGVINVRLMKPPRLSSETWYTKRLFQQAARKSGEPIPTSVKLFNFQDYCEEQMKLAFNLQDDEATMKELGKRAILEAHLARQEGAIARKSLDAIIEWLGMAYKEKMHLLRANFNIPGIADELGIPGALSISAWDNIIGDEKDKEFEKFLEISDIPIKTKEVDRSKPDLASSLLLLRKMSSIIQHAHTVSLDYKNIEENIDKYLKDFDTKANRGASATRELLKKQGKKVKGDEADTNDKDPERLNNLEKWVEYAEEGYVGDDPSFKEDRRISSRQEKEPFGRTYPERPKIVIKKNSNTDTDNK